ncbi:EHD3 (YDR036C) [Zygosaccharomyces parabailii]|nr:EHD3 (YDR036C) [Zygosaccharomyces parabailii]
MIRSLVKQSIARRTFVDSKVASKMTSPKPVLFHVQDTARIVTLNRPRKLNALNTEMSRAIFDTLKEYAKSESAQLIVIKSSNQPKSLCAGGDVAAVAEANLAGDTDSSLKFFQAEYSLNFQLATYGKPVVAFMDGITMGGGVGISVHNVFRVATEHTKWAMPEMDIGFFPDVASTFALPRLVTLANGSSQMALYLVLTGEVLTGEEAYLLGLASHYVPHANLDDLQTRLGELVAPNARFGDKAFYDTVAEAIEEFSTPLPSGAKLRYSVEQLRVIESCFNAYNLPSIQALFQNLDRVVSDQTASEEARQFASATKQRLLKKSPTSMQVALRLIQENGRDNLENAVKRDLYTAANFSLAAQEDSALPVEFSQAVTHKLIKKQKTPYPWKYRLQDLSLSQLTSLVSPKPSVPLSLLRNTTNITFKQYPHHHRYQLPSEREVLDYAVGPEGAEDHPAQTRRHVVEYFTNSHGASKGKVGTDILVNLILAKNCKEDQITGNLGRRH